MSELKVGQKVGYENCMGELLIGEISFIYGERKPGMCQIFVKGLGQSFDYPIADLITSDTIG